MTADVYRIDLRAHSPSGRGADGPDSGGFDHAAVPGEPRGCARLIGSSGAMRAVRRLVEKFGAARLSVLVIGESGTGKELVARALHESSARSRGPFVSENCAAIPEPLFESLVFGHVRGAFTGAERDHEGLFRQAEGGTLLLDEITEVAPLSQAKLLRALQEREVRPVGGRAPLPVDVRIVAATNRDPQRCVESGQLRPDLFYRLAGATIELPPLRDRIEDIPALAEYLVARSAAQHGVSPRPRLSVAALQRLLDHDWPGNVRELSNAIERAVVVSEGGTILPSDLSNLRRRATVAGGQQPGTPGGAERLMIERALAASGGSVSLAAVEIGWNRQKLYRRMLSLGIRHRPTKP